MVDLVKTKIILIGPLPPPYTGQSVSFNMLLDELKRRMATIKVIDISRGVNSKVGSKGLQRVSEIMYAYAKLLPALLARPKICYITISQSTFGFARDFLFVLTLKVFKVRVIAHLKGGNYNGFYFSQNYMVKIFIRLLLKMLDKLIVLGDNLVSMYDFMPSIRSKIAVVNNGLPTLSYGSHKHYSANEIVKVLYLSNLIESKGYFQVLESVNILKEKYGLSVKVSFAGEFMSSADDTIENNAQMEKFFKYIENNSLGQNVSFLGVVCGTQKEELLKESHFFCLPTNYINEGQPVSIIEAMAFGCVILSTDYRAITDLIQAGENGEYVPYNNAEYIASIINLIIHQKKFDKMSKNSISLYRSRFTRKMHLDNLIFQILN